MRLASLCSSHGDAEALTQVGVWYFWGEGLPEKYEIAASLFRKAGEQGCRRALLNLGVCYRGHGEEVDKIQAARLLEQADEAGDPLAKFDRNLLECSQNPRASDGLYSKSEVRGFVESANSGDVRAQQMLGVCYLHGRRLAKDPQKAIHYLSMAVDNVHGDSQDGSGGAGHIASRKPRKDMSQFVAAYKLGWCYKFGKGVAVSASRAASLFMKCAKGGHWPGEFQLAKCFLKGFGVPLDLEEARRLKLLSQEHERST
eukprot:TRINITY_DN3846_c0_g1_i1.p1 TRINITY_DN3846_c0_g1~~TRINITY_DN3846_c0_g1_i1.p1  ORF type:complete len:257 (-),score=24.53 TRINITY_DN3846_c0_g1_i1:716-1486(-)